MPPVVLRPLLGFKPKPREQLCGRARHRIAGRQQLLAVENRIRAGQKESAASRRSSPACPQTDGRGPRHQQSRYRNRADKIERVDVGGAVQWGASTFTS